MLVQVVKYADLQTLIFITVVLIPVKPLASNSNFEDKKKTEKIFRFLI